MWCCYHARTSAESRFLKSRPVEQGSSWPVQLKRLGDSSVCWVWIEELLHLSSHNSHSSTRALSHMYQQYIHSVSSWTWHELSYVLALDEGLKSPPWALWHGQSCMWAVSSWRCWKALLIPYLQTSGRVGKIIHHSERRTGKGHGMEAEPSEQYLELRYRKEEREKNHNSTNVLYM